MFSYLFLINRTIFVRETSFQQVLLSSSGPKENGNNISHLMKQLWF